MSHETETNVRAIIFDCDGMIVDNDRVSDRVIAEYGAPRSYVDAFFQGLFQECVVGRADLKEELSKVLDAWNWSGSADELLTYWFDPAHNRIVSRTRELVDVAKSKGIGVYVATNNEKYRTHNLFVERGLGEWFDGVFSSSAVGAKKPDPAFFKHIVAAVSVPSEEILFWDDDEENIRGAQEFGLAAKFYSDFDACRQTIAAI